MSQIEGGVFDPQTIELMKTVLDEAWSSLLPDQQERISRTQLAARILKAASHGERDPTRLRAHALIAVAITHSPSLVPRG